MPTNDSLFDTALIFALLNGKVSSALTRMLNRNFKENGLPLNADKWAILQNLDRKDGIMQQWLCDRTYIDKPSMSHLLDEMEHLDLVLRRKNPENRRERRVFLTVAGRDMVEKARYVAHRTLKEALQGLTQHEIRTCQEVLRKVFLNSYF